ncbi:thiamine phosphate synthase [Methanobrevibacter oralis]|uniref:Thiamine-phosphate synthase n=1 Tax=Methanobrevibacter oralis TaxID=66851 RepID=A0A166BPE4_METOA|nr:thiamine phosphate synthase [Methanobrevibacter oralis]KZX13641.1 thiamine-phosphate synthase [Methanobrevibacter oralis]
MNKNDLKLYLVTDNSDDEKKFLNTIEEAIKGGVSLVQIREKTKDTIEFYNLALKVKKITKKYNIPLIINDRIDVALAIDADGVHIGQTDMPCKITRKLIGNNKILGVSASTVSEAQKAEKDGADYIGSGAVFPTSTKDDAPFITKKELKEIVKSINIPVVAIGGITLDNASELKDTGIAGLSVVSAIMSSDNPKIASEKLKAIYCNL